MPTSLATQLLQDGDTVDVGTSANKIIEIIAFRKSNSDATHQHPSVMLGGVALVPEGVADIPTNHLHADRWVAIHPDINGVVQLQVGGNTSNWQFLVRTTEDAFGVRYFEADDVVVNDATIQFTVPEVRAGDCVSMFGLSKFSTTTFTLTNGLVSGGATTGVGSVVGIAGQQVTYFDASKIIAANAEGEVFTATAEQGALIQKTGFITVFSGVALPVIAPIGNQIAEVGVAKSIALSADQPVTFSVSGGPAGATLTPTSATTATYTATWPAEDIDYVEFYATNAAGGESFQPIEVTITSNLPMFGLVESLPWQTGWSLSITGGIAADTLVNLDTGDTLPVVGSAVAVNSELFLQGAALEKTKFGVTHRWQLQNAGAAVSSQLQFALSGALGSFGSVKYAAESIADIIAMYPAGERPDALAFDLQERDGVNLAKGELMLFEGGTVNDLSVPTNLIEPTVRSMRFFREDVQRWTLKVTNNYGAPLLAGQISDQLLVNGAVDWAALGYLNVNGVPWVGDGACVRPNSLDLSRIVHATARLTDDYIEALVMNGSPDDNDTFGPALYTDLTAQTGYHLEIVSNGTGNPDRIELKRQDNGVFTNLFYFVTTALVDGDILGLGYRKSTNDLFVFVERNGVRDPLGEVVNQNLPIERWGMIAEQRNTGAGCAKALAANGLAPLQIDTVNGDAGLVSIRGLTTVQFTEDYAPATVTVTDSRGLVSNFPTTATATDTITFVAALDNLFKGPITVSFPNGLEREALHLAPTGFQYFNTGAVGATGNTANIPSDGQGTLPLLTDQGHPIAPDGVDGEFVIASGTLPQSVDMSTTDGTGYGAAATVWFFEDITATTVPNQNVAVGGVIDVDLSAYLNGTGTLPLHPDPAGIGVSGFGLRYVAGSAPSGAAIVGRRLQGTLTATTGTHPATVTVTDPAGTSVSLLFNVVVNSAPVVAAAIADQALVDGTPFSLSTAGTFSDQDALTITATLLDGSPLSSIGLAFDGTTFSGTPPNGTAAMIRVTAVDTLGIPVDDVFGLTYTAAAPVAPMVTGPLGAINASAGVAWTLTHGDVFDQPVTYTALIQGGAALSTVGLNYNPTTRTFTAATPAIQSVVIELTGTNASGLTAVDVFTVDFALQPPGIVSDLPNPITLTQGQPIVPIELAPLFNGMPTSYTGTLPAGLSIINGYIVGIPTTIAVTPALITATNATGSTPGNAFSINVEAERPTSSTAYFRSVFK